MDESVSGFVMEELGCGLVKPAPNGPVKDFPGNFGFVPDEPNQQPSDFLNGQG